MIIFTFLNSGPNSMEGFAGFFLASFRITKPSSNVQRSDCPKEAKKRKKKGDCKTNLKSLFNILFLMSEKRVTWTRSKSEVAFTGRNRDRGTLIPMASSKNWLTQDERITRSIFNFQKHLKNKFLYNKYLNCCTSCSFQLKNFDSIHFLHIRLTVTSYLPV